MEQYILKDQISEWIAGRKVLAALFYSFNFDPVFFENYIMPLLVPGKDFREEIIYNKILWRQCLKEEIIPPVTVYCDYFAKNNTTAPSLGYSIHCLKLPAAPGAITNFHPKHIFLLLEKEGVQSLVLFTGSGNLSAGGWCENFEAFSVEEFKKDTIAPRTVKTNRLQDIITGTAALRMVDSQLSDSEVLIHSFLRYVDFEKEGYFNSIERSFDSFLEEQVFAKDTIEEIEIISPFFSEDLALLHYLKRKAPLVKCLIPASRHNEILLKKKVFLQLRDNGLVWSKWQEHDENNQLKNRNDELRNLHAKIYLLHGEKKTYTIVGSVNFTNTAWKKYMSRNNRANIESAWLYKEARHAGLLAPKNVDVDNCRFNPRPDLDWSSEEIYSRDMPELEFELDWETGRLKVRMRSYKEDCYFYNIQNNCPLEKGHRGYTLSAEDLQQLAKNTIIEIRQTTDEGDRIFSYYVQQEEITARPIDFPLDIYHILKFWSMLGDEYGRELMRQALAELVTDGSGIVNEGMVSRNTLLNEMAAHFNALIKLEKYIFDQPKSDLPRTIRYYLLSDNIDTLSFYLRYLQEKSEKGPGLHSFHWMILQILRVDFYSKALQKIGTLSDKNKKELKEGLRRRKNELEKKSDRLLKMVDVSPKQKEWIQNQLAANDQYPI